MPTSASCHPTTSEEGYETSATDSLPEAQAINSHTSSSSATGNASGPEDILFHVFNSIAGLSQIKCSERVRTAALCKRVDLDNSKAIDLLRAWAQSNPAIGSPRIDKLLVLVKFNVFRALISNSLTLGVPSTVIMDDDAISIFNSPDPPIYQILAMPESLRSTELQSDVSHHPWIDCLPIARMRQNLIRAGDTLDEMELCGDLVGLFSAGTGSTGMVVWGESWEIANWEVTEGYLETWGWTVKGCWELFESTNRWRERRGEIPLSFDSFRT